jgi:hypothetical protein
MMTEVGKPEVYGKPMQPRVDFTRSCEEVYLNASMILANQIDILLNLADLEREAYGDRSLVVSSDEREYSVSDHRLTIRITYIVSLKVHLVTQFIDHGPSPKRPQGLIVQDPIIHVHVVAPYCGRYTAPLEVDEDWDVVRCRESLSEDSASASNYVFDFASGVGKTLLVCTILAQLTANRNSRHKDKGITPIETQDMSSIIREEIAFPRAAGNFRIGMFAHRNLIRTSRKLSGRVRSSFRSLFTNNLVTNGETISKLVTRNGVLSRRVLPSVQREECFLEEFTGGSFAYFKEQIRLSKDQLASRNISFLLNVLVNHESQILIDSGILDIERQSNVVKNRCTISICDSDCDYLMFSHELRKLPGDVVGKHAPRLRGGIFVH